MVVINDCLPKAVFGLFELDDSGIVRYSRPTGGRLNSHHEPSLVGCDFFELSGLRNRADLKRNFRRFVQSRRGAHSFNFEFMFPDEVVKARIMMTRVFRTELWPPEGIVFMDIRSAEQETVIDRGM